MLLKNDYIIAAVAALSGVTVFTSYYCPSELAKFAAFLKEIFYFKGHHRKKYDKLLNSCKKCIYLDYNATTPLYPEVTQKINFCLNNCFGNPSSSHVFGVLCKEVVNDARMYVAKLVNSADPSSIIFTGSGTESDNGAIDISVDIYFKSCAKHSVIPKKPHIITCSTEHPAILLYLNDLLKQGVIELSTISVDEYGVVNLTEFANELNLHTALVTIMHANNEVGTIQPLSEISRIIQSFNDSNGANVLFHVDAAQSVGKIELDVQSIHVDMASIVGHKFGAPKGIGVLYVHPRIRQSCRPMAVGGGQEGGMRAGTEAVTQIAGLGEAARVSKEEGAAIRRHVLALRCRLLAGLRARLACRGANFIRVNGFEDVVKPKPLLLDGASSDGTRQELAREGEYLSLPNTLSISFRGVRSSQLMPRLAEKVACSAGSACHSTSASQAVMSTVLAAMKVPLEYGLGTLRLSVGRQTTVSEIDRAVEILSNTILAVTIE